MLVARSTGTLVKSDTTSKKTMVISWCKVCPVMKEANSTEFLLHATGTYRPREIRRMETRCFDSTWVEELTNDTIGRKGVSGLCTLGSPYTRGTIPAELLRC